MARTTKQTSTTSEKPRDLMKELLGLMSDEGVKAKPRWSPTKKYASLIVGGTNVGYVWRQNRNGIRVMPALSKPDLPKGIKGFEPSGRPGAFALKATVSTPAELKAAAAALVAAAKLNG